MCDSYTYCITRCAIVHVLEKCCQVVMLSPADSDDENYDSGAPHRSDLCEKCKQLGRNCRGDW